MVIPHVQKVNHGYQQFTDPGISHLLVHQLSQNMNQNEEGNAFYLVITKHL